MRLLPTRVVYEEYYKGYSVEVWFGIWWHVNRSFTRDKDKACEMLAKYRAGESLGYKKYTVKC